MVTEILNAYQLKSTLGRLEFFVGAIGLALFLGIIILAARFAFFSVPDRTYLTFRLAAEIAAVVLALPLVVARLRDIGWHPATCLLAFSPIPFDPKVMILLAPDSGGLIPIPGWMILLGPIVYFVYLFFVLTLLFWKGRATVAA